MVVSLAFDRRTLAQKPSAARRMTHCEPRRPLSEVYLIVCIVTKCSFSRGMLYTGSTVRDDQCRTSHSYLVMRVMLPYHIE